MTGSMPVTLLLSIAYAVLLIGRFLLRGRDERPGKQEEDVRIGIYQIMGSRQLQSDAAQAWSNRAGIMAVIADGIGRANTGRVCAQIAADTILDRFEPYQKLNDPAYFFRSVFFEANKRIQQTIGERRGGASTGAVFLGGGYLYYAVAGDIRIAIVRGQELIPLSRGQTMDVLAVRAYEEGKISRQDAVWSMEEKRLWNYLGQDGFHEIEICEKPILLKEGDKVLLVSKGIFEELSYREMEDILIDCASSKELAERLARAAEKKDSPQKDNGSVILIQQDGGLHEKKQF